MRLIDADALRANLPRVDMDLHIMDIKRRIDRAPTVDAVPVVRGEWTDNVANYKCSVCSEASRYGDENYCPNCGALMEDKT